MKSTKVKKKNIFFFWENLQGVNLVTVLSDLYEYQDFIILIFFIGYVWCLVYWNVTKEVFDVP